MRWCFKGRGRTTSLGGGALCSLPLALALTVGALGCGGGAESGERTADATPSASPESIIRDSAGATAGVRLVFIGTSLTSGFGLDPDSAYPAAIQRLADSAGYQVTVAAAGLSGETSAGTLRRVDWVLRQKADVVVIETGANDGLRGLDPDTTQANIVGIIRKVRAANPEVRVLLAQMEAPPNLGPRYTRGFRDVFMTVARKEQVPLIPFFLEGVAGDPALNQGDGTHPNAEGARRAALNMWRVLSPLLRETPGVLKQ